MTGSARSLVIRALVALGFVSPAILILMAAGCRTAAPPSAFTPVAQAAAPPASQFAGNQACAECHKSEFELHHGSKHAVTLRVADKATLASLAPSPGAINGTPFALAEQEGKYHLERVGQPIPGGAIQYAFGSGKTVITFVGDTASDRLTEFGVSYRPHAKAWCITPGQERISGTRLGTVNELGRARRCISCHAVAVKPDAAEPEPGFLGVGCESCHGPASAHIAAVKSGASDIKMERITTWGAARIDAVCARCHRGTDDLSLGALETNSTARFQPYGLEMSPCFKKSGDKLSCVTCHNPHTDVSTDQHAYEKACLSCHSPASTPHNKVCPVNPKDKCIGCHMPKEPVFASTNIPVSMADHLIWAYKKR